MTARLIKKIQQILKKSSPQIYKGVAIAVSGNFADISLPDGKQVRAEALNKISRNQNVAVIYDGNNNYYCWFQGNSDRGIVNREIIVETRKRPRPKQEKIDFAILYSQQVEEITECVNPYWKKENNECIKTCALADFTSFSECADDLVNDPEYIAQNTTFTPRDILARTIIGNSIVRFDLISDNYSCSNPRFSVVSASSVDQINNAFLNAIEKHGVTVDPDNRESTLQTGSVELIEGQFRDVAIIGNSAVNANVLDSNFFRRYFTTRAGNTFRGQIIESSQPEPIDPNNSRQVANEFSLLLESNPCLIAFPIYAQSNPFDSSGYRRSIASETSELTIETLAVCTLDPINNAPSDQFFSSRLLTFRLTVECQFLYYQEEYTRSGDSSFSPPWDDDLDYLRTCQIPGTVPYPQEQPDENQVSKEYYLKFNKIENSIFLGRFRDEEVLNFYLSSDNEFIYVIFKAGRQNKDEQEEEDKERDLHDKLFFYKISQKDGIMVGKSSTYPEELDIDEDVAEEGEPSEKLWNFNFIKEYFVSLDEQEDLSLFKDNPCLLDFVSQTQTNNQLAKENKALDYERLGNFIIDNPRKTTFYSLNLDPENIRKIITEKLRTNIYKEKQIVQEDKCKIQNRKRDKNVSVNSLLNSPEDKESITILQIVFFNKK